MVLTSLIHRNISEILGAVFRELEQKLIVVFNLRQIRDTAERKGLVVCLILEKNFVVQDIRD